MTVAPPVAEVGTVVEEAVTVAEVEAATGVEEVVTGAEEVVTGAARAWGVLRLALAIRFESRGFRKACGGQN